MRFGVTSMTGLVAGLLAPFGAFLRTPAMTAVGAVLLTSTLAFLYLTLQGMQSNIDLPLAVMPPSGYEGSSPQSTVDPSMKSMLVDIYGE